MVVPMLFVHLPTPAMAGAMAAKLFSAQTWLSTFCVLLLLVLLKNKLNKTQEHTGHAWVATILIVTGLVLALLSEYAVAPRIVARENLRLWHSAGSAMYFLQWVCAAMTLAKLSNSGQSSERPTSA